jgi:hypothetical protein
MLEIGTSSDAVYIAQLVGGKEQLGLEAHVRTSREDDFDRWRDAKLSSKELPAHANWHLLEVRRLYCGNTDFKLARAIQVPLKLIVRNAARWWVKKQFIRSECAS